MSFIRNIFALIGLIALVGGIYGYQKFSSDIEALGHFDSEFNATYMGDVGDAQGNREFRRCHGLGRAAGRGCEPGRCRRSDENRGQ